MKLSIKTILGIFLITALSILLVGCWAVPPEEAPGFGRYNLTMVVSPIGGGVTGPEKGSHTYDEETEVVISATPAAGYQFIKWTGDVTGSANPTTLTVDSDKTVTANFQAVTAVAAAETYTLTTAVDPANSGTVTGGGTYGSGETATVEATATKCYVFDHWSGDLTGSTNPTTILMDGDKSVTAHFVENDPPYFTSTPVTEVVGGTDYYYDADATDPEGDTLTYAKGTNWPGWLSLDTTTGEISGRAPCCYEDSFDTISTVDLVHIISPCNWKVDVKVSDECNTAVTQSFTITVSSINSAPVITSIPDYTAEANTLYTYTITATDTDCWPNITYSLVSGPDGMTFDGTDTISWTPTCGQLGGHSVTVRATDNYPESTDQTFIITVSSTNYAPAITPIPDVTVDYCQTYTYQIVATDTDCWDTITYSKVVGPTGMTVNSTTGLINWWIGFHIYTKKYPVTVRATDNGGLYTEQAFTITVRGFF